jgi:hypothetical protein
MWDIFFHVQDLLPSQERLCPQGVSFSTQIPHHKLVWLNLNKSQTRAKICTWFSSKYYFNINVVLNEAHRQHTDKTHTSYLLQPSFCSCILLHFLKLNGTRLSRRNILHTLSFKVESLWLICYYFPVSLRTHSLKQHCSNASSHYALIAVARGCMHICFIIPHYSA